jgi:hypothetical protein
LTFLASNSPYPYARGCSEIRFARKNVSEARASMVLTESGPKKTSTLMFLATSCGGARATRFGLVMTMPSKYQKSLSRTFPRVYASGENPGYARVFVIQPSHINLPSREIR